MLSRLLDKLENIIVPDGLKFDVLIVDNCSTDDTRGIVSRYVAKNPDRFRYVYESNIGLSNARNRGLIESHADVINYLDDDCIPHEGWLEGIFAGYIEEENVGVVGGQIMVIFPDAPPPRWLEKPLYPLYGELKLGSDKVAECRTISDFPYGGNISFRRDLALRLGGFDKTIGRIGNQKLSGEETKLCWVIQKAGYRILINPRSVVDHLITADRISIKYLIGQAWGEGKGWYTLDNNAIINQGKNKIIMKIILLPLSYLKGFFKYPLTLTGIIKNSYYIGFYFSTLFHGLKRRT